jgi:hypothetical protein
MNSMGYSKAHFSQTAVHLSLTSVPSFALRSVLGHFASNYLPLVHFSNYPSPIVCLSSLKRAAHPLRRHPHTKSRLPSMSRAPQPVPPVVVCPTHVLATSGARCETATSWSWGGPMSSQRGRLMAPDSFALASDPFPFLLWVSSASWEREHFSSWNTGWLPLNTHLNPCYIFKRTQSDLFPIFFVLAQFDESLSEGENRFSCVFDLIHFFMHFGTKSVLPPSHETCRRYV